MSKYYEAYDNRYKQVHNMGLSWSLDTNTKIIKDMIIKYHLENEKILEIGCGEGRDARYLLKNNYNLLAVDVSQEAINYCQKYDIKYKEKYRVLDVLKDSLQDKYGFIYSVACLHMLVLDDDRNKFYNFIYNHLEDNGYALILTMGDGTQESKSDISKAYDNVKRIHQETNQEMKIAMTSCRIVNFETLLNEVTNNGFKIIEYGITEIEKHFSNIMYIIVKKVLTNG